MAGDREMKLSARYKILNNPGYKGPTLRWIYYDRDNFHGEKHIVGIEFETKKYGWCLFFKRLDWLDWISG